MAGEPIPMQVNLQKLSPVLVEFDVQVDAARVKSELDRAYQSVAKSARVRGFRPGKAPRKVLSHVYGARIAADVAQRLVDETFPQAVSDHKLQPVSTPAVEPAKLTENQPFSYKARVEIIPEIDSVAYEGLEAERPKVDVTDEQVDAELLEIRRAHSTLEPPKESRPAAKGDVVTIDFTISVDGAEVDGAGANDFQSELGGGTLIPAIEDGLTGKQIGDQVEVDVEMPAQHLHPQLRGKTAHFHLLLKDIKERVVPEADDEFAKDVGEFESLSDLKA